MWTVATRYDQPLGCIMLDVDHFKSVNDTHGHARGDDVLREVSKVLLECVRECDVVARYGGEEFCVVLPNTGASETAHAAERLRLAIEMRHCAGLNITSSFGVSALEFGAGAPAELIDQADKALYVAKRSGRNRVAEFGRIPSGLAVDPAPRHGDHSTDAAA